MTFDACPSFGIRAALRNKKEKRESIKPKEMVKKSSGKGPVPEEDGQHTVSFILLIDRKMCLVIGFQ